MAVFVAGVVAIVQFAFLALLLAFLVVRRFYDRRQRASFEAGRGEVAIPLRAWLVGDAHPAPVVAVLRRMPRGTAVGYLALLARQTIPDTNRDELADAHQFLFRGRHQHPGLRRRLRRAGRRRARLRHQQRQRHHFGDGHLYDQFHRRAQHPGQRRVCLRGRHRSA